MNKRILRKRDAWKGVLLLGTVLSVGMFVAACGGGGGGGSDRIEAALAVEDQSLDITRQIVVSDADIPSDAWLVIYEDNGGDPSNTVLGLQGLSTGSYSDLKAGLERGASDGELLHLILHDDLGAVGTWEPGTDTPMTNGVGSVVADSLVVSVSVGTPDVRLTVTSVGDSHFRWTAVEPSNASGIVTVGADDPALTLTLDERYEIVNLVSVAHPFELMSAAGALLSEAQPGTLEGDAGIDWTDNGSGTFRFTATATLGGSLGAYRCFIHRTTMTGTASID